MQAAHALNLSNKQEASPQQLQDAILGSLSFLSDGSFLKSWQRIAKFCNLAMLALQGHATMTNRAHWSAELAVHSDSRLWPQTSTQTPQTPDSGPKL